MRDVIVKTSWVEGGIGSTSAHVYWESEPTDEGAIVRLDHTDKGQDWFLTFTDAEEFDGSYVSVRVTMADLNRLYWALAKVCFP